MPADAPITTSKSAAVRTSADVPEIAGPLSAPLVPLPHPFALSNSLIELLPNDENDDGHSDDDIDETQSPFQVHSPL